MNLATLLTEARNPATEHIDELPTLDMLRVINNEDAKVAQAVAAELPNITKAVDEITRRFQDGGRLFYIGAGTSGRLGVLDASECPPTFSVPPTLVQGLIAGGDSALRKSSESLRRTPPEQRAQPTLAAAGFTGQRHSKQSGHARLAFTPAALLTSSEPSPTQKNSAPSPSHSPAYPTPRCPHSPTSPSPRSPARKS